MSLSPNRFALSTNKKNQVKDESINMKLINMKLGSNANLTNQGLTKPKTEVNV